MFLPRPEPTGEGSRSRLHVHIFATRQQPPPDGSGTGGGGGGGGGISGAAIGGIIAAVILTLIVLSLIIYCHRKRRAPSSHPHPTFALSPSLHGHKPQGYAAAYPASPPYLAQALPPYTGPPQSVYYPDRSSMFPSSGAGAGAGAGAGQAMQMQMPQAVHLPSHGSYYAAQQPQAGSPPPKEVRFGQVGVRRFEG